MYYSHSPFMEIQYKKLEVANEIYTVAPGFILLYSDELNPSVWVGDRVCSMYLCTLVIVVAFKTSYCWRLSFWKTLNSLFSANMVQCLMIYIKSWTLLFFHADGFSKKASQGSNLFF